MNAKSTSTGKPKTLIAIPAMDTVKTEFMTCLMALKQAGEMSLTVAQNSLVYKARADLTLKAVKGNYDYILWLDSDMSFAPDLAQKLLADAEQGLDFVTGICFKRTIPTTPTILKTCEWSCKPNGEKEGKVEYFEDYPADSLFEVAGAGMAACLTKVDMLKHAAKHFVGSPFEPLPGLGEDYSLCWRLRQIGYKLYCDSRVKVGHIGSFIYDEDIYRRQE